MEQIIMDRCQRLIENKEILEQTMKWDDGMIDLAGAGIFTAMNEKADPEKLKQAGALLKQKAGMFSEMRGEAQTPILCIASLQPDPNAFLDLCMAAYKELRKVFSSSAYLPMAAVMMAQKTKAEEFAPTAAAARKLYDMMKGKHFFLTGDDDSPSCVMMALSGKDPSAMIEESEKCFAILKQNHFSQNAVQALSNTLAVYDGTAEEKCAKAVELSQLLRKNGFRGDSSLFLSGLGVLSVACPDTQALAAKMMEIESWMKEQKGFGFLNDISQEQRIMMAGMLAQMQMPGMDESQEKAIEQTIAMTVEEEMLLSTAWIWVAIW